MNEESVHEVTPHSIAVTDGIGPYDSREKKNETKEFINEILDSWDNGVLVFDFGHYYYDETINNDNEGKHFFFKTEITGSKKYIETLFPNGKDTTTDYRYFDRSIKEVCNISKEKHVIKPGEEGEYETQMKEIVSKKTFKTDEWANKLATHTDIGGCLLVSSIKAGNHQSAVWVVLKNPIEELVGVRCCMTCEMCSEYNGRDCGRDYIPFSPPEEISKIFKKIDELLFNELVFNSEQRTNNEIYRQSTRAAISQVFVRDIANNLVLNVLKHLRDEDSFSYPNLYKLINKPEATSTYTSDIELRLYNHNQQLANLFSYVADRCLYLSKATYGVAKEDGVLLVYGELFKNLDANRILLNHISGKKNFKYKIIFMYNGNPLNDTNDIQVSLPAGALGAQAFYSILENIIRNTAKPDHKSVVVYTVNFIDKPLLKNPFAAEDQYYRVEISDNVPIKKMKEEELKHEIENIKKENQYALYFGRTKDNETSKTTKGTDDIYVSCADNTGEERITDAADLMVYKQNTQLNNSVIDPKNHTLRTRSLGLIVMEASAAFLRQEDLPEIEREEYDLKDGKHYNKFDKYAKYYPYFIQTFKKELDNQEGLFSLGYRFYMKKPN